MFIRRVRAFIQQEQLIDPEERVLVGASGGIDSSVLLFSLLKIRDTIPFSIGVAHLNHGLRGDESARDEAFVRDLAGKFGLPFHLQRADVRSYAKEEGLSLQHAGRNARYAFFREVSAQHGYHKIAIGHTRDDQVETFIMRIIKGTGLRGLSSIPVRRGPIIRPLLCCYRSEIEDYLREESIPYVEDSSNQKDLYQRNFIRRQVLPLFEKVNPNFRERILFLLDDLTRLNSVFEESADRFLQNEVRTEEEEIVAGTEKLKSLDAETRYRVLSGMLQRIEPRLVPLRDHIGLIEQAIRSARPNIDVSLPCGVSISRTYDKLTVTKKPSDSPISGQFPIRIGANRLEPFGIDLACDVIEASPDLRLQVTRSDSRTAFLDSEKTGALSVRTYRNGDRFVPLGMNTSVKLKNFFIARKIPLPERRRVPLLLSGDDIIWVCGLRIDERYKVTESTRHVLRVIINYKLL